MQWRKKRESVSITREITIPNKFGMHARPAAEFARRANSFRSEINLVRDGTRFSATSLMDILRASLEQGAKLTVEAHGPDAQEAVDALLKVLTDFQEEEGH